ERGESLATAESLTGGGIAGRITSVSGASRYFRGAAVVYTDESKKALLGVGAWTLETDCVVSCASGVESGGCSRSRYDRDGVGAYFSGGRESSLCRFAGCMSTVSTSR